MAANRVLKLTNRGQADFYEDESNGTHKIALRALASVAADVTFSLPGADGSAGQILQTDGAGNLSFSNAALADTEVTQLTILDQGELRLREATGGGTNHVAHKAPAALTTDTTYTWPTTIVASKYLKVAADGTLTWSDAASTFQGVYDEGEDLTFSAGATMTWGQANNENVLEINKTAVGVGIPLSIDNDGTGHGIYVKQDGAGNALHIDAGAATAVVLDQANNNVSLDLKKTGSGVGNVIDIDNDGVGHGIFIKQDGAGNALHIDGGALDAVVIDQANNFSCLDIGKMGTGAGDVVDISNAGTGSALKITQTGGGIALEIDQDGNDYGIYINQSSAGGTALNITSAANAASTLAVSKTGASTGTVLNISNSGTGYDIAGDSNEWYFRNGGGLKCTGLVMGAKTTETITGGLISIGQNQCFIEVAGQSGLNDDLDNISGGVAGQILILTATASSGNITVTEAGNINRASSGNMTLTAGDDDMIMLIHIGTGWVEVSRSNN